MSAEGNRINIQLLKTQKKSQVTKWELRSVTKITGEASPYPAETPGEKMPEWLTWAGRELDFGGSLYTSRNGR